MKIEPDDPLRRAAELSSVWRNPPARAEGVDVGGSVRVVLGPDGLPVEIRVLARPVGGLGPAVEEAFAAASAQRLRTWSEIGPAAAPAGGPRDPVEPPAAAAGRRIGEIAEDVIAALGEAGSGTEQSPGVGSAGAGLLVLVLSYGAGVRCSADPGWVSRQDAAALDDALAGALRDARSGLAVGDAPASGPGDRLLAEARAALDRIR